MGMMYAATFTAVAATVAQDVFEAAAPADAVVVLHSCYLAQDTDEGDAQAEMLQIQIIRGNTTTGSGGTTLTPGPTEFGYAAAGGVYKANNTTVATAGTAVTLHADAWNVQTGWQWIPTPETRVVLSPSQRAVVRITAPADSITLSGTLVFEEIGG